MPSAIPPIESISKIDAAERQLVQATLLLFERRDQVATHTLAAAGHQILADIGRHRGYAGFLRNPDVVKQGHKQEFRRIIASAENGFKHADRDPDAHIKFTPFLTHGFLLDAVCIHRTLTTQVLWEFGVYGLWFESRYPDLVNSPPEKQKLLDQLAGAIPGSEDMDLWLQLSRLHLGLRIPIA